MRLLYASERPPYPLFLGGAVRSAHQLLRRLTYDLGVECTAVGSLDYSVSPWSYPDSADYESLGIKQIQRYDHRASIDCGYNVQLIPDFHERFDGFLEEFKPDVVWAQLESSERILNVAHARGVKSLFYVHDAEFRPDELKATIKHDCHIVCGSGFLATKVRNATGRRAHVVYPASELYFGTTGDPQGHITMINPHRVKGIDVFFEIAQRMPQEQFLLLESWKLNQAALAELQTRLARVPNVRFQRRVSDMQSIYRQTKLLLVPSVWEEGFGMVAIEAQSCRIPVIASARGGLPESVGDGGVLIKDYRNVDLWVRAINEVLADSATYAEFAESAVRHAGSTDFRPDELARRFLDICVTDIPRATPYRRTLQAAFAHLEKVPGLGRLFRARY